MKRFIESFTLIETLVGIVILGLIMVAMSRVLISAQMSWSKQSSNVTLLREGRWALEFMSNEFRCAKISSVDTDFWPNYWDRMRLGFEGDIDNDGSLEKVWYERRREWSYGFINKFVRRSVWIGGSRIDMAALVVDNPGGGKIFTDNGNGLITIELTLRPRPDLPEGKGNRNITLRTKIRARNP